MLILLIESETSTVGTIIAVISIIISIIALLTAWARDRGLRRKEYADRIRNAAGLVIAKLERWKELSIHFFDGIQPLLTDADRMLLEKQDFIATRDFLWRELVAFHATSLEKITNEQIEIAYKDLYGYDPSIQKLFAKAIERLKEIDTVTFILVLQQTQKDILDLKALRKPYFSSQLGNELRKSCGQLALESKKHIDFIIAAFRNEMIKLIQASDSQIVNRDIRIEIPKELLSSSPHLIAQIAKVEKSIRSEPMPAPYCKVEHFRIELYEPCHDNYDFTTLECLTG